MRVAFDVGPVRARPSGVGLFATAMANALASALPPNQLVLIGRRPDAAGIVEGAACVDAPAGLPYIPWMQYRASLDVRHAHCDIAHYTDGMVPVVRAGRTVLSVHDMSIARMWRSHPARRWLRVPLAVSSPRLADLVIVPSRATADEVMHFSGVSPNRIEVVPYAPQDLIVPATAGAVAEAMDRFALGERDYILSVGTIEPRKNHARLIEAFELAVGRGDLPDTTQLVIVGQPGWRHEPIIQRARRSPLSARIRLLGYVASEDLAALYGGCAVAAYVSLYEGFGLPVVEAMAHGAATVTSNVSSMPEVAGEAGFLVHPHDSIDIARGLSEALEAATSANAVVRARSLAQAQLFSWRQTAEAAVAAYRRTIS